MKKQFLSIGLGLAMVVSVGFSMLIGSQEAYAKDIIHICPGNGSKCDVTITIGGREVTINGWKTADEDTIRIE